jgi:hypothetical protein
MKKRTRSYSNVLDEATRFVEYEFSSRIIMKQHGAKDIDNK